MGKAEHVAKAIEDEVKSEAESAFRYGQNVINTEVVRMESALAKELMKSGNSLMVHIKSHGHFNDDGTGEISLELKSVRSIEPVAKPEAVDASPVQQAPANDAPTVESSPAPIDQGAAAETSTPEPSEPT